MPRSGAAAAPLGDESCDVQGIGRVRGDRSNFGASFLQLAHDGLLLWVVRPAAPREH